MEPGNEAGEWSLGSEKKLGRLGTRLDYNVNTLIV